MDVQDAAKVTDDGLVVVRLSDVQPEAVEWLWPQRVPLGKLTNLVGDPELLKTTIAIDLAARVTTGRAMPDGSESDLEGPAGVLFLMGEDGVADTIRPRVDAAGGDPERVRVVTQVEEGSRRRQLSVQRDAEALLCLIEDEGVALVVLDPLTAYLGAANTHKDSSVRTALAPLVSLTAEAGIATVAIRHLNKDAEKSPMYRSGGSIALTAVARSEILVGESDDGTKVLAPVKMNLAERPPALAYDGVTASNGAVRIRWEGEALTTPADLLSNGGNGNKRDLAKQFLRQRLADGPVMADALFNDAEEFGISRSTLKRAKKDLGDVQADKLGLGPWRWGFSEDLEGDDDE